MAQTKCKRCEFVDQIILHGKPLTKELVGNYQDRLDALLDRSGMDISPCHKCGIAVISIPDGLTLCKPCAEKAGN
jgi:hypothetical protein